MNVLKEKRKVLFLLVLIVLVAGFFRFWQLDTIPPGVYPDEAINGNDALATLETGEYKIFYPENNGREGLFYWLIAFSFGIFGPSIWALKFISALFGTLTIIGIYLLTKEIFYSEKDKKGELIAILASVFLAISFYHVNFSRIAFRAILIPFILTFAFYFLYLGFRKKKYLFSAISGIFFGLGFYTYISYRFVPLLVLVSLIPWFFIYRKEKLSKKFLLFVLTCIVFTFIVALPIGIYFLQNPGDFFGRAAGVSILNTENPVTELGKSLALHFGMFNVYGDANWRHNLSTSPQLLWPIGIFFIIGVILSLRSLIVFIRKRNFTLWSPHLLLISWFLIFLLPGFLSAEGTPHALRVISLIPAIYIFAAIGAHSILNAIAPPLRKKKQIVLFCIAISIFFAVLSYAQFNKYFYEWAQNPNVQGAFTRNYVDIGDKLNSLPHSINKFVIVNEGGVKVPFPDGVPVPAQTIMFIENTAYGEVRSTYVIPEELENIETEGESIFIFMKPDVDLLVKLYNLFPDGDFQKEKDIWIYQTNIINPEELNSE